MPGNSQEVIEGAIEDAIGQALRHMRESSLSGLSASLPTALKLRYTEEPVLGLAVELAAGPVEVRAAVVLMLFENIAGGCGHLSINRAKQALKQIARMDSAEALGEELANDSAVRRKAALVLLGWRKQERALAQILDYFEVLSRDEQALASAILTEHYKTKLAFYLNWKASRYRSLGLSQSSV